MASNPQFITLGKGSLYFAPFAAGTQNISDFRFLGNAPSFSLTIDVNKLDHYDSTQKIKQKDKIVVLETTRSGAITLDEIHPDNVAMFLFGLNTKITEAAATGLTESFTGVKLGRFYAIGISSSYPSGRRNIDPATFTATKNGGGTLVAGTDYVLDAKGGMIHLLEGASGIADGDQLDITYDQLGYTRNHVKAGGDLIEGALKFISNNPTGAHNDVYIPYASLTPTGDMQLIGDDWMQIPLQFEALTKGDQAAVYVDDKPV